MPQETGDQLGEETEEFARRLEQRAAALSKVLKLQRHLFKENERDSGAIVRWLELAAESTDDCPTIEKSRVQLLESWRRAASVAFLELEANLREFCQSHGWRLDGQWPDFVVERGVSVRIDERNRTATAGELRCPATVVGIGRVLQRQVPELVPKDFSRDRFAESLLGAWDAATGSKGGQVPILAVYRWAVIHAQTAKFWRDAKPALFTPLSTDQFRARLAKMLESGTTAIRGRELRLLPPLDPKDAFFVYQPSEARFGYVGRVEFLVPGGSVS